MPTSFDVTPSPGQYAPAAYLDVPRGVSMMGSEASLRKILVTVHDSLRVSLPDIATALAQDDVPRANQQLHAIKGFLPIFATDVLVAEVTQVEFLSKTGTADAVTGCYTPLAPKLAQLLADIAFYLGK